MDKIYPQIHENASHTPNYGLSLWKIDSQPLTTINLFGPPVHANVGYMQYV